MVYEMGDLLGESERFPDGPRRTVVDVDLDRLRQERMRQGSFHDNAEAYAADQGGFRVVPFALRPPSGDLGLRRAVDRFPFVPDDEDRLAQDCYEAYNIQVSGLEQRMRAIGGGDPARMPKIVIGVSGGLDSTHALIVAAKACDRLGLPRTHIIGFTMPGFATSAGTKSNAIHLMESLEITWEELDIRPAATQMLKDLGHPFGRGEEVYDVTFENVQAGLRTDYLFRAANQRGGIVLGTGDLSELALGWCTYGVGDQMSHYGVNTGVPKTLMQHLIRWVVSSGQFEGPVNGTLLEILDQEISPELVPTKEGERIQSTEDSVGPYALQDFTLFHVLRRGYRPSKIAFLAEHAWSDAGSGLWPAGFPDGARPAYDLATIRTWMRVFHWRFFANQFKRSAIPNGPKVVSGRVAVAARGLADAVGRRLRTVAGRARGQRPRGLARLAGGELFAQAGLGAPLGVDAALVGVELAHEVHVGDDVLRGLEGRPETRGLARPVDERQRDRQTRRAGDPPEARLPVLTLGAGALGGEDQQERLPGAGLGHEPADHRAGVGPVERDATEARQQPAERAAEDLLLDQHPGAHAAAPHDEQHHHEVPVGRVRGTDEDAGARHLAHGRPAGDAQHEGGESTAHRGPLSSRPGRPAGWRFGGPVCRTSAGRGRLRDSRASPDRRKRVHSSWATAPIDS